MIEYALYAERGKAVMKKTSEVSKLVGVSRRTLQYYDDEGILAAARSKDNHRLYDDGTLEKIWQILLYKEMGFELKEIRQLLQLSEDRRKEYLIQRIRAVKSEIECLNDQAAFISLALTYGLPQIPEANGEVTYVKSIEDLKKKLKSQSITKSTMKS